MYYNIINNIRLICIKSIQKAKSGHPGMPLGIADIFTFLWFFFYKNNFKNIKNLNKDKIIISNGHGVIIQYTLLYLTKIYKIIELKNLRKFGFNTPAHPELSNYIDASTGPLGNGIGIGIGIGIKNKIFKNKFNKKINIFNNKIWIFCGDGCLMEGVGNESVSFCGALNVNNIILIYDSNNISIDGIVKNYFFENIKQKFNSINWDVIGPIDGHDYKLIKKSLKKATLSYYPILIYFKTVIGFLSSDKSYSETVHGSIFNKKQKINIYKNYTLKYFFKKKIFFDIKNKYIIYFIKNYYFSFLELIRILNNIIIKINLIKLYFKNEKKFLNKSTRFISYLIINDLYKINEFIGGSADLTSSNLTKSNNINVISKKFFQNRFFNYGVREFSMTLINYGIVSEKNIISFCSTFLVFSNYMYNAIRNFTISKLKNIFIFTHDSFSIGEDGPSHQPIEHLKNLRSLPRFYVFRPYNLIELIISWYIILKLKKNSSSLILSRQDFKNNFIKLININNIIRGGYKLTKIKYKIDITIVTSGSDMENVFNVYFFLKKYFNITIVSLYCLFLFEKQKKNYKNNIFSKKTLFFESSNDILLNKYNIQYLFIFNIKKYGKSASEKDLQKYFNFTKKNLIKLCLYLIKL
ncbi:transketolase-like TK C-terminal-containing protein [Candidatus Carsonella ruddii]|uniref:transketolase-like TK C-terminal-containing protein n=1 Tax=Carsonella ruddii TaxID=114186 RepID=UPI003D9A98D5